MAAERNDVNLKALNEVRYAEVCVVIAVAGCTEHAHHQPRGETRMRIRKNRKLGRRLSAATVGAMAAGIMALGTSPASAAPYWQVVNTGTGPQWLCGPTKIHKAKSGVGFQTCLVVNSNADAQAVLVVVNNSKDAITLSGGVRTDFEADADCYSSTLNPGFQRGCFGPTVHVGAGGISAYSYLRVNGVLDYSQGN